MVYLILDLDETVFVTEDDMKSIHPAHTLSPQSFRGRYRYVIENLYVINPEELSDLITYAYEKHEGVIILTSGKWDKNTRSKLASQLYLSKEISDKLRECRFHSSSTDDELFQMDPHDVRNMDKNTRLNKIIDLCPELSECDFVVLDDNNEQIDSFKGNGKVKAILATTDQPSKSFYQEAIEALDECSKKQEYLFLCGPNSTNPNAFFNESSLANDRKRKASFDEEGSVKKCNYESGLQ